MSIQSCTMGVPQGSILGLTKIREQPFTLTITSTDDLQSPNQHVFGLWEDGENMQTPHRRAPAGQQAQTQNPSAVLTTTLVLVVFFAAYKQS